MFDAIAEFIRKLFCNHVWVGHYESDPNGHMDRYYEECYYCGKRREEKEY